MADLYSPFALATPPRLTPEQMLAALVQSYQAGTPPPVATAPTPGGMMAPPGQTAASEMTYPGQLPGVGARARALLAGPLATLGVGAGGPVQEMGQIQTARGEQVPALFEGADLQGMAAEDPAGASIGAMLGHGPALRALGAVGSGIMSIPGVRPVVEGAGRTLARPAVGVPLALGGSVAATTGEAQAPTRLGPRASEAQTNLDKARKKLEDHEARVKALQETADRYTPENRGKLTETDIRDAQQALGVRVDGKRGPETNGVLDRRRQQLLAEIAQLAPTEKTIREEIKTANDRRTAAERLDTEDAGRKALEESQPGPFESMAPTFGAYGLGMAGGHMIRNWLSRGATARAASQKAAAETTASQFGQGDLPTRIGRLNEFWTEGGAGRSAPPFALTPSGSPSLQTPSPVAPWSSVTHEIAPGMMGGQMQRTVLPPDQLYRPGLGTTLAPTAATMGLGGAESASAQFLMLPGARRELEQAQAILDSKGPTPENVDRVVTARRAVAFWEGMQNLGRGVALGALGAEAMHPLRNLPRPSTAAAETERGAIDLLLHPRAPVTPPTPPTPPTPAPLPLAHSSNYQPRAGGRFAPGRPVYPPGDPRRGGRP